MELFIADALGVGNEAANQIFTIVMNAGSALSIASAIATLITLRWASIASVGWTTFFMMVKGLAKKYGTRAAVAY
jgi:circular bacteriocin, circularin A/uberolysin family